MGIVPQLPNVGDRFHAWTVISPPVRGTRPQEGNHWFVMCRCECGTERRMFVRNLVTGHSKSCGCLKASFVSNALKEVPDEQFREHAIWKGIKSRCNNPNRKGYARYGGKGVSICDEWNDSYAQFFADMGPCPEGYSIDRIDNSKGYEPGNCRWADRKTQAQNRSVTVWLTYNGETLCLRDWAERIGMTYTAIVYRLKRGWTVEQALSTPKGEKP